MKRTATAMVLTAALALTACSGSDDGPSTQGTDDQGPTASTSPAAPHALVAAVASFDLAVGEDQRVMFGIFQPDRTPIVGGDITVQIGYLGDSAADATEITVGEAVTAPFLPVPGNEPDGDMSTAHVLDGSGNGVYAGRFDLDQPGFWGARIIVELDDGSSSLAQASFEVLAEHAIVAVGEPAWSSTNLTVADADADLSSIDSRAGVEGEIPDPHLHDKVIAESLAAGRPMVIAVTTPVYCTSRFCGPITDRIAEMADEYGEVADFFHLEVWKNNADFELNEAAEQWIYTEEYGAGEPWVFFVDGDGIVQGRWDDVLDEAELRGLLDGLAA